MADEYVLDASVAAKVLFVEDRSDLAVAAVRGAGRLIAPDLLFIEIASVCAKRVRRGDASAEQGAEAVRLVVDLLDEAFAAVDLTPRAFALATAFGFSVYDAMYLALAERHRLTVLTADIKLADRARREGLGALVETL